MKAIQRELLLYALWVGTVLMTACTSPGYNDNPSQQIANARVGCPAATDFFAVYFSLHVQPYDENRNARIAKEAFRPYCNDLPTPGKVFLTADLVGRELRKTPITIRVVERQSVGAENFEDLRILSEVPPKTYAKGLIESNFELDRAGHYAIYLIRGGEESVSYEDTLRIPLNVGVDSGVSRLTAGIIALLGIASGLLLIGFVAFRLRRRRALF